MGFLVLLDGSGMEVHNCVLWLGYFVVTKIYGPLAWIHELRGDIIVCFAVTVCMGSGSNLHETCGDIIGLLQLPVTTLQRLQKDLKKE